MVLQKGNFPEFPFFILQLLGIDLNKAHALTAVFYGAPMNLELTPGAVSYNAMLLTEHEERSAA